MRRLLRAAALAALLLAGPEAGAQTASQPIKVQSRAIPLNPSRPGQTRIGALTYRGGLELKAKGVAGFGGFSGLALLPDGGFLSQSDEGDLLAGRLVLDDRGRLAGLAETTLARLTDEQGQPYPKSKQETDAEDIALLPGGGFAISFERDHRVEAYTGQGPARRLSVPPESSSFPSNSGLEALAVWTDGQGRERLVEGAEDGRAWSCDLEGRDCLQILDPARDTPDKAFSLTGLNALPDGKSLVAVYRAFDLIHGARAIVAWVQPEAATKVAALARLAAPLSVDNMEGVAAAANPDGSIRLYLISDDNFSKAQRTILLAFDWRKPAG